MNRRLATLTPTLILGVFTLSFATAAAELQGPSFELFSSPGGSYSSATGLHFNTEPIGVRGSFHFTSVWALDVALSRASDTRTFWDGEVSAKAYLFQAHRVGLYALAGPGIHREDVFGRAVDSNTVHAGIGGEDRKSVV